MSRPPVQRGRRQPNRRARRTRDQARNAAPAKPRYVLGGRGEIVVGKHLRKWNPAARHARAPSPARPSPEHTSRFGRMSTSLPRDGPCGRRSRNLQPERGRQRGAQHHLRALRRARTHAPRFRAWLPDATVNSGLRKLWNALPRLPLVTCCMVPCANGFRKLSGDAGISRPRARSVCAFEFVLAQVDSGGPNRRAARPPGHRA